MSKLTGFGMKDCLSLASLSWQFYISLKVRDDEPIYTYRGQNMRHFIRQSKNRRRVGALSQKYNSEISDTTFKFVKKN